MRRTIIREERSLPFELAELRVKDGGDRPKIGGYAVRWDARSETMPFGREKFRAGAFTKSLQESDVASLLNHNDDHILGRTSAGTLRVHQDDKGMFYEAEPPEAEWARAMENSIRRKDIVGNSFRFRAIVEEWRETEDGPEREIIEAQIIEMGPQTFPAYPQTDVSVRSLVRAVMERPESIDDAVIPALIERMQNPELTDAEFRGILQPAVAELEKRIREPGPESHSPETARAATETRRRRLDLLGL